MKNVMLVIIAVALFIGSAQASEYAAFTRDLVQPYDFYKKSLALTSKKEDADKAKSAINAFVETWTPFAAKYAADVPKPFAGIADFSAKIKRPAEVGRQAAELLKAGDIGRAHSALEEVRYLLWEMRVKADIVSLSDKANDFHEAMEIVLDHAGVAKSAEDAIQVFERYGAWFLIKWDDMANADDLASVRKSFDPAFAEGRKAVVSYLDTLKQGDPVQAKKLSGSVKGAYKKVWMLENQ
jgi:hypothetical protein